MISPNGFPRACISLQINIRRPQDTTPKSAATRFYHEGHEDHEARTLSTRHVDYASEKPGYTATALRCYRGTLLPRYVATAVHCYRVTL